MSVHQIGVLRAKKQIISKNQKLAQSTHSMGMKFQTKFFYSEYDYKIPITIQKIIFFSHFHPRIVLCRVVRKGSGVLRGITAGFTVAEMCRCIRSHRGGCAITRGRSGNDRP